MTKRKNRKNVNLVDLLAAAVGVLGGALVGGLLVRAGVKPTLAAAGVATAGGIGAMTMPGWWGTAAAGAGACGAGQLALAWLDAARRHTSPRNAVVVDVELEDDSDDAGELAELDEQVDLDEALDIDELLDTLGLRNEDDVSDESALPLTGRASMWARLRTWWRPIAIVGGLALLPWAISRAP